jgi:hypothetical protein
MWKCGVWGCGWENVNVVEYENVHENMWKCGVRGCGWKNVKSIEYRDVDVGALGFQVEWACWDEHTLKYQWVICYKYKGRERVFIYSEISPRWGDCTEAVSAEDRTWIAGVPTRHYYHWNQIPAHVKCWYLLFAHMYKHLT